MKKMVCIMIILIFQFLRFYQTISAKKLLKKARGAKMSSPPTKRPLANKANKTSPNVTSPRLITAIKRGRGRPKKDKENQNKENKGGKENKLRRQCVKENKGQVNEMTENEENENNDKHSKSNMATEIQDDGDDESSTPRGDHVFGEEVKDGETPTTLRRSSRRSAMQALSKITNAGQVCFLFN